MSQQLTFADSEFSSKRRQTRKDIFLSRKDSLLPWIQRNYPLIADFKAVCQ